MKTLLIAAAFVMASATATVYAEKTLKESATATKNDAVRGAKKVANRAKEAVCAEGDVKCAAKKAKHRVQEGTEYTSDKVKEAADTVDSNDSVNH